MTSSGGAGTFVLMPVRNLNLTDRERSVVVFIKDYMVDHGVPPTITVLTEGLKLKSRSNVHRMLNKLVKKGWLEPREVYGQTRYFPVDD